MLQRYALEKLFALFLLTIAICLLADPAQSATIIVNPGDSIPAAIDASAPGDTIQVFGGIYKENCQDGTGVAFDLLRGIGIISPLPRANSLLDANKYLVQKYITPPQIKQAQAQLSLPRT